MTNSVRNVAEQVAILTHLRISMTTSVRNLAEQVGNLNNSSDILNDSRVSSVGSPAYVKQNTQRSEWCFRGKLTVLVSRVC